MKMRVQTLIDRFLTWAEHALAPATVAAYRHQLAKFVAHNGNLSVKSLAPVHLTGYAKSWHEFQAVIRLCNWAVEEAKILTSNPFVEVKLPIRGERQRVLQYRHLLQFLRAASAPGRAFLLAMMETLARPQEIRAACWQDLQSETPAMSLDLALSEGKALIVLREYKDRKRRKGVSKPRILLVSRRLGRLLLRLRSRRDPQQQAIFTNSRGRAWSSNGIRCLMRRLRVRLDVSADQFGERVVAYSVRHTMATLMAAWGLRDRLLADLLGHVETRTTSRYQHLDVTHLREAIDRAQRDGRRAAA